jgi:N-methylhydantoinase A
MTHNRHVPFDDQEGATRAAKVNSTKDPIDTVFEGIGEMDIALGEINLFSHGTTVATNALITREYWGIGELLPKTTEGFRAMLERRVVPHWKNGPQESRGA